VIDHDKIIKLYTFLANKNHQKGLEGALQILQHENQPMQFIKKYGAL
jgi:hypothetical protein